MYVRNNTVGSLYVIGLEQLSFYRCTDLHGNDLTDWSGHCDLVRSKMWENIDEDVMTNEFSLPAESSSSSSPVPGALPWSAIAECKTQAISNRFNVVVSTVTLIFTLIGCLNRIRKNADSNFQKLLASLPDTIGLVTLGVTLEVYHNSCLLNTPTEPVDGLDYHYYVGPGFVGLFVCWCSACVRVFVNWITPVPGGGEGMCHLIPHPRWDPTQQSPQKLSQTLI